MNKLKSLLGLAGWVAVAFAAAGVGARTLPGDWYVSLIKPPFTPPAWIFAPVWTLLYLLMGVAAWRVWNRVGFRGAGVALTLFIVQLTLNALWSYVFFGLHRTDFALINIGALWMAILSVVVLFWRVDFWAGALLLPYLFWVSFASYLNLGLWRLNR